MPKKPMPIWDKRMFELIDYVIANKVKGITGNPQFIKAIGIPTLATLDQVKNGKQSFRPKHFHTAAKYFDISMEWFFGFTSNMKRVNKETTVEELLLQALLKVRKKK